MTDIKHLTNNQLIAYHDGSLESGESHIVGRHLLMCSECRKLLPVPSVEKFWAAILKEDDSEDDPATGKSNILTSFFAALSSVWSFHSGLALGMVLLLIFTSVIWLNTGKEANDIAQNFEIGNDLNSEMNFPAPIQSPSINTAESLNNSKPTVDNSTLKQTKIESPKPKFSSENKAASVLPAKNPKDKQEIISSTRGVSKKCSENADLDYELSEEKDNFVFKWKKVPKAAKYHLYISDDEEILIDEYETETETTFVLNKKLDPLKTYKWKILVTLENGQTIPGPSNKFTVKDFQTKQMKSEKTRSSDNRCGTLN